jgi:4-aminobutyrate aminotransferase
VAPTEVAAIFVEPVQGEGGYIVPPASWLRRLRALCDKYGILLVADEVQSGMGRTGRMWAIEHSGVQPDILISAKGIASGLPLGAFMARAPLMEKWGAGAHGSTYGGSPVPCAAGLATLDVIEKEHLLENSAKVGKHILARMADWPSRLKLVGDVRGRGLMIGVEIVKDKVTKEYGAAERDRVVEMAFEKGILFLGCGPSTIRLCPALVVTKEEADVAVDVLEECISAVGKNA